jgi:DNA polymerase III delta prime subunit
MERVSSWEAVLTPLLLVEKFIEKNRLPHLLFYGPPGTGKTSTILAVARRIYGPDYRKQILEVRFIPLPG